MLRKIKRCSWVTGSSLYIKYHDCEWGVPIYNDKNIFECLLLESFQAGLSWIIILKKRDNFRKSFDGFDYKKIAKYSKNNTTLRKLNSKMIRKNFFKKLLASHKPRKLYKARRGKLDVCDTYKTADSSRTYT